MIGIKIDGNLIIGGSKLSITKDRVPLLVLFLPVNETNITCVSGSEVTPFWTDPGINH